MQFLRQLSAVVMPYKRVLLILMIRYGIFLLKMNKNLFFVFSNTTNVSNIVLY